MILRILLCLIALLLLTAGYSDYAPRCEALQPEIERILAEEGASLDYYYLAVAESHCDAGAVSKRGAVGVWQMMPATARAYGCNAPEDVACETRAAARYLLHLETKCGRDSVIYCWHDGGTNFLKRGAPTAGARGLHWQYKRLLRENKHE